MTQHHLEQLFRFYNHRSAPFRFYAYQGGQRSTAEKGNILLNGGKKYNKAKRKKTNKNRRRKKKKREPKPKKKPNCTPGTKANLMKNSRFRTSNKVPIVVFGDGMKGKENARMKGQLPGFSGVLLRSLHLCTKQLTGIAVMIGEYNTSKACSSCRTVDMKDIKLSNGDEFFGVQDCKNCGILWDRDVNASKNMAIIAFSIWNGSGRPPIYTRTRVSP